MAVSKDESKRNEIKCMKCEEKASFFHSRCCNAHLEGIITHAGELQVVCEKCKKYVGTLFNSQKDITKEDAVLLIEYLNWLEDNANVPEKLRSQEKEALEKVSKVIHVLDKLVVRAE